VPDAVISCIESRHLYRSGVGGDGASDHSTTAGDPPVIPVATDR
jgi:hypothetical protein